MTEAKSVLALSRVGHRYGARQTEFTALRDIDLEVNAGEMLFLMGPSGSGKTTLIQIMGCLLRPTEGRVLLGGEDVARSSEIRRNEIRRRQFGFVFQAHNLFPTLTATENVMVAYDLLGVEPVIAWRRSRELLATLGLTDRLDALPAQLSGGQRQRVGVARALAGDPAILLADEPTAALDAATGHSVMEMLRRMAHHDTRAIVVVTHDSRIIDFADRIVRLDDGRILTGARLESGVGR
jgi:putative ABC transport system ATP-binding protein